jgi:hypothetical protein
MTRAHLVSVAMTAGSSRSERPTSRDTTAEPETKESKPVSALKEYSKLSSEYCSLRKQEAATNDAKKKTALIANADTVAGKADKIANDIHAATRAKGISADMVDTWLHEAYSTTPST